MTPPSQLQPSLAAPSFFALPPQIAGFWLRGFAFAADVALLVFLGYSATLFERDKVLALGKAGNYVGLAIGVLYFFLCNGPIGRGRTLGKILLQCRVQADDAQPLTWRATTLRSLIQLQIVFPLFLNDALHRALGNTLLEQFLVSAIGVASLALLLATAASVIMDPFRQGFHDRVAGSFVRQELGKNDSPYRLPLLDEKQQTQRRFGRRNSWIVFSVVCVVGCSLNYRAFYGSHDQRQTRQTYLDITADLEKNYSLEGFEHPSIWIEISRPPSANLEAADDSVTTAAVVIGYYRFGAVEEQALLGEISSRDLENQLAQWARRQLDGPLQHLTQRPGSEKKIRFECVVVRYSEVIGLFFYFQQRLILENSLPLPPGREDSGDTRPAPAEGATEPNASDTSSTVIRNEPSQ